MNQNNFELLTGLGQDSHRLGNPEKPIVLGGVRILAKGGPFANSDGDVILHALCNAFELATQLGSIGCYADQMLREKGITDSALYLALVQKKATENGFCPTSVSVSVEAGAPKLESFSGSIKKRLGELLNLKPERIGLTFTSGEGLTEAGQGRGIAVLALVNFRRTINGKTKKK